jgi:hypothetical protein
MQLSKAGQRIAWPVRRSVVAGMLAASGMALVYSVVVAGASGSLTHLTDQVRADWYLLAPIISGFGVQIGLLAELRRRRRLAREAAVAGATGASGSAVGMIACCAHHLAEFAPFIAVTGATTFLVTYRVAFMAVGLAAMTVGITLGVRRLRHLPTTPRTEVTSCAAH